MTDARLLWAGAVTAQAADVATSVAGLSAGGREANPIAQAAIDAGGVVPGLVGLSLVRLGLAAGLWGYCRRADVPAPWVVPVGMAGGGLIPAAVNTVGLLGVVG